MIRFISAELAISGPTAADKAARDLTRILIQRIQFKESSGRLLRLENPFDFLRQQGPTPKRNVINLARMMLLIIRVTPDAKPRGSSDGLPVKQGRSNLLRCQSSVDEYLNPAAISFNKGGALYLENSQFYLEYSD